MAIRLVDRDGVLTSNANKMEERVHNSHLKSFLLDDDDADAGNVDKDTMKVMSRTLSAP